jgi:alcohol dehydrogenase class IV
MQFRYETLAGRVRFGAGVAARLGDELDRLGTTRALAIASKRAADELAGRLGPERCAGVHTGVTEHVPVEAAAAAREAAARVGADCLVAMGGGSAIGLAKAVALELGLPIVAVPTSYSGSEMTPIYGLTSAQGKRTGRDPRVLPRVVLYDPELTVGLPPRVTGSSGMNALAHCVEALYGPGANPVTALSALEGTRALARGLPVAVSRPEDLDGRTDALYGAHLGGASLAVAGVAIHHQLCHVLGGSFGLPHADLNAVVLPHAARFVGKAVPAELAQVAGALGTEEAATGLYDFARRLGTPSSLAELGMAAGDLDRAAELAVGAVARAPRPAGIEDLRALLGDAFEGRRPAP